MTGIRKFIEYLKVRFGENKDPKLVPRDPPECERWRNLRSKDNPSETK